MERNPYLDNIKFLLIILVVFGHLIAPVRETDPLLRAIYLFIYTFHMPMFVLLSGYFSSESLTKHYLAKNLIGLVLPYLIFQNVFMVLEGNLAGTHFSIFRPFNAMWYLASLFAWRIMLPVFLKLRFPVLLSLGLALLAGCSEYLGQTLSASRTMFFFPFFLAGYHLKKSGELLEKIKLLPKLLGCSVLLLFALLAVRFPYFDVRWFRGADAYSHMVDSYLIGAAMRSVALVASGIIGFAFLAVVPRQKTFFTYMGERTLYVYLWHFLLLRFLYHSGLFTKLGGIASIALFFFLAVGLSFALVSDLVVRTTRPIIEPFSFLKELFSEKQLSSGHLK